MRQQCENCASEFMWDAEKCLYGTLCHVCYDQHLACVMAFFVGLYSEAFYDELDDIASANGWSRSDRP